MIGVGELEEAVVELLSRREIAEVRAELFAENLGLAVEVGSGVGTNEMSAHEVTFEGGADLVVAGEILIVDRASELFGALSGVELGVAVGIEGGVDTVLTRLSVVKADFFSARSFVVESVGCIHVGDIDFAKFFPIMFIFAVVGQAFFDVGGIFKNAFVIVHSLGLESGELAGTFGDVALTVAKFGSMSGATKFGDVKIFLSVSEATSFAVLKALTESFTILPRFWLGAEVFGAAISGFVACPRTDGAEWTSSEFVDGGRDLTRESARHFEE